MIMLIARFQHERKILDRNLYRIKRVDTIEQQSLYASCNMITAVITLLRIVSDNVCAFAHLRVVKGC